MGPIPSKFRLCSRLATQSCISCRVILCKDCDKIHINGRPGLQHRIVPFGEGTCPLVYPQCPIHDQKTSEGHCKNCQIPVCIKCVSSSHRGHDIEDLADVIAAKRKIINKDIEEIESILQDAIQQSDVDQEIQNAESNLVELDGQAKDLRQQWHGEVDGIFDNLEHLIKSFGKYKLANLEDNRSKIECRNSNLKLILNENKDLLIFNIVSEVYNYKSKLTDFRNVLQIPELREPSLKTKLVQGKERKFEFGNFLNSLTMTSLLSMKDEFYLSDLLVEPKVIAIISTQIKNRHLCRVACVGSDRAWVCGQDKAITLVDLVGSVRDTVISTCLDFPGDIQINEIGELVYSDVAHKEIKVVRNGVTTTLITTPNDWFPYNLCCTRSGDMLIGMGSANSLQRIIRYQGEKRRMEIDKDEHGNPIFHGCYISVTENINGDIVTTDAESKAVIALDNKGRVKFRYNQSPPGREKPFCPGKVVTDSAGRIIVADENHCLHIIDQNGRYLQCVDQCGLDHPSGLSLDSEGRLWVGSYNTGQIKVIQYRK